MKNASPYSKRSLKRLADYPDVLTVEEASELLGVCTKTVYSLIKKGFEEAQCWSAVPHSQA